MRYSDDKNEYYERISKNEWKDLDTGHIHNALEFEYNKPNNYKKEIYVEEGTVLSDYDHG